MKKNEDKGKKQGLMMRIVFGSIIGLFIIILILAILSFFVASGSITENTMKPATLGTGFAGSLIGAFMAARKHRARVLIVGGGVGGIMFFLTLLGGAFNGGDSIFGELTLGILISLVAGGVLGGLMAMQKKKRKRA